jgi:hypothetical protein
MVYIVTPVTAALIRISSSEPLGKDRLASWLGYPSFVDYDGVSTVDCSKINVHNAKEYRYQNSDITYSLGKARRINGVCTNLEQSGRCLCNGACMTEAPKELQVDSRYVAL